jgi:predicted DNA-binding antitoxin AbrB/MazE fold protein
VSFEFQATYENGVLKPDKPLPFEEHERVTIHVKPHTSRIWERTGALKWLGDPEVLRMIAEESEMRVPGES